MDDGTHAAHGTQLVGYRTCLNEWCADLVLEEVAQRTRGFCTGCYRKLIAPSLSEIEVRNRGRRMTTPVRLKTNRATNKGDRETQREAAKANERARKRLSMIFPELYDVLRAEERSRVGLDPWPVEAVVKAPEGPTADESIDFARVLAALDDAGIEA